MKTPARTMKQWNWLKRILALAVVAPCLAAAAPLTSADPPLSPTALAVAPDGKLAYVGHATANSVAEFNPATGKLGRSIAVPAPPLGLVLSRDGRQLFVTCATPESSIVIIDTAKAEVTKTIAAGHTAIRCSAPTAKRSSSATASTTRLRSLT